MKLIKNTLIVLTLACLGFNASLSFDNYDEAAGTVGVYYVSDGPIGGFQFGITGVSMTSGSGGEAAANGFTVSSSSTTMLGFSFTGATMPATETPLLLTTVSFTLDENLVELCFNDVTISTGGGQQVDDITTECLTIGDILGCIDSTACNFNSEATLDDGSCEYPDNGFDCAGECSDGFDECGVCGGSGTDADADGVCDDVDSCVGVVDECGVCNGPGFPDGACDCQGTVADVCGDCGGSETNPENCVDGYSLSFGQVDGDAGTIEILYSAEGALGGVQFNLTGVNLTDASGGEAGGAGWTMEASGSTFLGFSFLCHGTENHKRMISSFLGFSNV